MLTAHIFITILTVAAFALSALGAFGGGKRDREGVNFLCRKDEMIAVG